MSVAFLQPFFDALLLRGMGRAEIATQLSISEEAIDDPSVTIPANSVYAFLKWSTVFTGDPMFTARVGQVMASGGWLPLLPLMASSLTLGDFFQKFSLLSSEQNRAATYKLVVEGPIAIWQLTRPSGASKDAAFADAVAAGFFGQLLKLAAQDGWGTGQIIAVLPDPTLVPRELLPSTSVMMGQVGMNLRFPSNYLSCPMPKITHPSSTSALLVSTQQELSIVERVQQIVELRISEPSLGVENIAKALGLPKWKLQSFLNEQGTSVSVIREDIRCRLAIERMIHTQNTVTSIAADLGYTDSSNFTRAFRSWTGKSPRETRKNL